MDTFMFFNYIFLPFAMRRETRRATACSRRRNCPDAGGRSNAASAVMARVNLYFREPGILSELHDGHDNRSSSSMSRRAGAGAAVVVALAAAFRRFDTKNGP